MKRAIIAIFGVCFVWLFLIGSSNGIPVEQIRKTWPSNEIVTLKSIKELFLRPKVLSGLVRGAFPQMSVAEDPHCPPGFQRDRRGSCREVW